MKAVSFIIFFFLLAGCSKTKNGYLSVYFENNSGKDTSLIIDTYLNGNMYNVVNVKQDSFRIYDDSIKVPFKIKSSENLKLMFVIKSTRDTTICFIPNKKIDSVYYIHVNAVKTIFPKGYIVFDKILDKDSVAYKSFYCEIVPKRNSP